MNANYRTMTYTKSELMTAYNRIRAIARMSNNSVDVGRINKAFGILLSKKNTAAMFADYSPNRSFCLCKDTKYFYARKRKDINGNPYRGICKHMAAILILDEILLQRAVNKAAYSVQVAA